MENLPKPKLVINAADLRSLVGKLIRSPKVSVDTESNSLFAYRERVCLVQFSIPGEDYLVDPLALDSIDVLGDLFADPKIEKIFHAAEYDILVMRRDFGFEFSNLFDTMVAARIIGRKKVGLGSLLEEFFGVKANKKFQRADWGKRPLDNGMLRYARMDTHYLIRIQSILAKELETAGRMPIANEDFERLSNLNGTGPGPQVKDIWRINGVRDLSPEQATVLQELADYRQGQAEKRDLPLFKVISDKTLLAIADQLPKGNNALAEIQGMTPNQIRRHSKGIFEAIQRGLAGNPSYRPKRQRMDDDLAERIDWLKTWRKNRAKKMGVESDVILPRDVLIALAEENPSNPEKLAEIMSDIPWRLNQFGSEIGSVLKAG